MLEYAIVWLILGGMIHTLLFYGGVWWVPAGWFGAWLFAYLHFDLKWYHLANLSNITKRKSYYARNIKITQR